MVVTSFKCKLINEYDSLLHLLVRGISGPVRFTSMFFHRVVGEEPVINGTDSNVCILAYFLNL